MPGPPFLELRIAGPGVDLVCQLEAGADELLVGRDASCAVCLPDPRRSISRRHLAVRNQGGELHFRVLSQVNGVQMPFGEAPPGARGVLRPGQQMGLGGYVLTVVPPAAQAVAQPQDDPWAVFEQQDASGTVARPRALLPATGPAEIPTSSENDPFGDWGFQSGFGPGGEGDPATGLEPFFHGLGLTDAAAGPLSDRELEAMGRLVREAVLGLLALHRPRPGDPVTMAANPLTSDEPAAAKLRYLFGGHAAQGGQMSPDQALRQLLQDLGNYFTAASAGRDVAGQAAADPDPG
ncbi:FHA domain-containing protein [Ramlibacter tataouinensis]|uniref:FHA domain-containing protein n=1 Tax=Ramlibacter tataouinensis TaxID=94132 RepID=UPI0013050A53|nr:FHA domain-containing protein [Ramlibacter tataouinensis]